MDKAVKVVIVTIISAFILYLNFGGVDYLMSEEFLDSLAKWALSDVFIIVVSIVSIAVAVGFHIDSKSKQNK